MRSNFSDEALGQAPSPALGQAHPRPWAEPTPRVSLRIDLSVHLLEGSVHLDPQLVGRKRGHS